MSAISRLSDEEVRTIAGELQSGRLTWPATAMALARWLDQNRGQAAAEVLEEMHRLGFGGTQAAYLLHQVLAERAYAPAKALDECLELVLTGPGDTGAGCRDTSAVVQSLFASAQRSVDVVGFTVYQGRQVFRVLADRMKELPALSVRMFLNIPRERDDYSPPSQIQQRFLERFRRYDWPADVRLPELFYDPRSLELGDKRASLHAKCVLVDSECAFISSANFTEAAHERNVEAGVIVRSPIVAERLRRFLDGLVSVSATRIL